MTKSFNTQQSRQNRINERRQAIERNQSGRKASTKFTKNQIDRAILGHAMGEDIPQELLHAAEYNQPKAFNAASAQRTGDIVTYSIVSTLDSEAHRIHRAESSLIKKTALPIAFFGGEPVMVEPNAGIGHGDFPPAPVVKPTGGRVGYKWHEPSRKIKQTFTPTYSDSFRKCEAVYHLRVVRGCHQLIHEAAKSNLYRLEVANRSMANKIVERFKKREFSRYCCIPQDDGSQVFYHNQDKEGGSNLAEITHNYHKGTLYAFLRDDLMTPAGTKIRSNEDFGGDYQGWRGDGRKKAAKKEKNPDAPVKSFSVTSRWTSDALSRALNSSVSKKSGRGMDLIEIDDVQAEIETLIQVGAIGGLKPEKRERLEKFIAYCRERNSLLTPIENPKSPIDVSGEKRREIVKKWQIQAERIHAKRQKSEVSSKQIVTSWAKQAKKAYIEYRNEQTILKLERINGASC